MLLNGTELQVVLHAQNGAEAFLEFLRTNSIFASPIAAMAPLGKRHLPSHRGARRCLMCS
jgi:hypothetical protein